VCVIPLLLTNSSFPLTSSSSSSISSSIVIVNVKMITEMGAYVQLLEYNNIEGMILLSELSRRRIRSIHKLIRVGKAEVVMVIRVDKEKGYIDLSKRRVSPEDIAKTEERFNKAKAVHSTLRHMSYRLQTPMAQLYKRIAWPLYKKHGHCYDAFQLAVADPEAVFKEPVVISLEEMKEATDFIRQKMTPQPLKVRADIQVTCFSYEGVEAIRAALIAGQALSTELTPIKVQLIAPPLYVMLTTTLDKAAGVAALNAALDAIKTVLEAKGGRLQIKSAPSVTTDHDESELARMLHGGAADGEEDEEDEDEDKGEEDNEEGMGDGEFPSGGLAGGADFEATAASEAAAAASAAAARVGEASRRTTGELDAKSSSSSSASSASASSAAASKTIDMISGDKSPSSSSSFSTPAASSEPGGDITFTGKKKVKKVVAAIEEE